MAKLKVTLKRSLISRPETQRKTVRSLGLRKINSFSILPDVPTIRGQNFKVKHLVTVEEIADEDAAKFDKKSAKVEVKAEPVAEKKPSITKKIEVEKKSDAVKVDAAKAEVVAKTKKIVDAVKGPAIAEVKVAEKSEEGAK